MFQSLWRGRPFSETAVVMVVCACVTAAEGPPRAAGHGAGRLGRQAARLSPSGQHGRLAGTGTH